MSPESRLDRGKTWPAPAGTTRVKALEIYRYDPDSAADPRLDTFEATAACRAAMPAGD